ncbi:HAD-superfamily hydrolase, subfamily IA, variant 3 (fragment) [Mesorhizobium plurifarium]|uniref:HAD-superfamily hydrolase, subfamily IA, variant 3 n=1 Tax=Mesorhizobium plurifarium TaxID=69974 RepID=A0A090DF95_MESPL
MVSLLRSTLGAEALRLFASIRTGKGVSANKPHPEVYRLVLSDLDLNGLECLCIEDSRNGLLAARAAGMRTVITPSQFTCHENFSGADLILRNLALPWSSPEFHPFTSLTDQPVDFCRLLAHRTLERFTASRNRRTTPSLCFSSNSARKSLHAVPGIAPPSGRNG